MTQAVSALISMSKTDERNGEASANDKARWRAAKSSGGIREMVRRAALALDAMALGKLVA
jgi:hypothetical protein